MYSIPGFDPCYPFDFSKPKMIKFFINCRNFDETNSIAVNEENVGYDYRDVLIPAKKPEFKYLAQNSKSKLKVIK